MHIVYMGRISCHAIYGTDNIKCTKAFPSMAASNNIEQIELTKSRTWDCYKPTSSIDNFSTSPHLTSPSLLRSLPTPPRSLPFPFSSTTSPSAPSPVPPPPHHNPDLRNGNNAHNLDLLPAGNQIRLPRPNLLYILRTT